jgi:hypothetical protein
MATDRREQAKGKTSDAARRERLAAELRANLRRRKAQRRGAAATDPADDAATPSDPCDKAGD